MHAGYICLGRAFHHERRSSEKAEEMYRNALRIAEKLNNLTLLAVTYKELGIYYGQRLNAPKARNCLLKAKDFYEKAGIEDEVRKLQD